MRHSWWVWIAVTLLVQTIHGEDAFQIQWPLVRAGQPSGLSLELKLPKTDFYQGEIIPATLVFTNASTNPYHLWIGTYDRSGRITDIGFHAVNEHGEPVTDPLQWYFKSNGFLGGGLGNFRDLGQWSITLTANQWLRFDKPGTYRLYAWSNRPHPGKMDDSNGSNYFINLVSDIATIRVVPLPEQQAKTIMEETSAELKTGGKDAARAVEILRYLPIPAAQQQLLELLDGEYSFAASMGLIGAVDPTANAQALLQLALRPEVAVTNRMLWLYPLLKTADVQVTGSDRKEWVKVATARSTAKDEFLAAIRESLSSKQGKALAITTLTLLVANPHDKELRANLVAHKDDLDKSQIRDIVSSWEALHGKDLLPVLEMAVKEPLFDPQALGLLAKEEPELARPLIIEDLLREKSRYVDGTQGRYAIEPLLALPDRELPELDDAFRSKLLAKDPDLFHIMPLISRYATTNLLAEVLVVYRRAEGRWACDIQDAALRYWIRCQPTEGVAALARVLESRVATGCYRGTLAGVLMNSWNDAALPVVIEALEDDEPDVVDSAVRVLEQHAGTEVIPQVIVAIKRLAGATFKGVDQTGRANYLASNLQHSKRWCLIPEQLQQLTDALLVKPTGTPFSGSKAAARIQSRWASPPTNWTLQVSANIRPYEEFSIAIAGADVHNENFRVSALTKIDGKEIGGEAEQLTIQGRGNHSGIYAIVLVNSYLPVFQFPKSLGEHSVDLVLSTAMTDYHFQQCVVRVKASEEDSKLVAEFEASGANRFLNDPYGITTRRSKTPVNNQESIPYAEVIGFVARHPKGYLTDLIARRTELLWLWDVNEKGIAPEERLLLGKILGAIDKERYVTEFRTRVGNKFSADVSKSWLDGIESYAP